MNIENAKKIIKAAAQADDTVIIESYHGLGKSSIVAQFAKENNYEKVDLFLSHQEVGDIVGLPRSVTLDGEILTTWSKPIWLQRMIDAAWPTECEVEDLSYSDKDFEKAFKDHLNRASGTITRAEINEAYARTTGQANIHKLHLVAKYNTQLKCSKSRPGVLFLDELNRAPIDVRQSALQLVLEKQIHEHELPYVEGKATLIVAAINPASDYQTEELDDALLDRFLHVRVEPDAKAWLDYARKKNVNDIVRAYIGEHPKDIFVRVKDDKDPVGATPRSWEKLASFIDKADQIPGEILFDIIKGKIGSATGAKFLQFYNNYAKTLKFEDVEKAIIKSAKKHKNNPEKVGEDVAKLMKSQEPIQKSEMAEQFYDKYVNLEADKAFPLLGYLYGLEVELLAAFIKKAKADDMAKFQKLAMLDMPNKKALFIRITSLAK